MFKAGVPASSWMWAKARSKLGAFIGACGDRVVSNVARMRSFCIKSTPSAHRNKRTVPTHHCTADAQSWRSRLAMHVGEGQKQTRCIDSRVRRHGGVECSENEVVLHDDGNQPLLHIETDRSDPPLHCRCPKLAFPPRHACGRRPEAN
jgi:hypothetical protein